MNKLVLVIVVIAFVFIISYDPKNGKKLNIENYQQMPVPPADSPAPCDEVRYLQLQGFTGGTCGGANEERLGVVYSSPNSGGPNVKGFVWD